MRYRFVGQITGVGTASGLRVVLGRWLDSPFGAFADAMVQRPDGERLLLAPTRAIADFIAATYTFDTVRLEPVDLTPATASTPLGVRTPSLHLTVTPGPRTRLGTALRCLPPVLAESRWWNRAIDPVASRWQPGVHTFGVARAGREEWYAARDVHAVAAATVTFEGVDAGPLARLQPPVDFGFSSAPAIPSITDVTTLIRDLGGEGTPRE